MKSYPRTTIEKYGYTTENNDGGLAYLPKTPSLYFRGECKWNKSYVGFFTEMKKTCEDLLSKTPQQFLFNPNPFLLSFITNYKKHSFKISEIDQNTFWVKQKNNKDQRKLHSFFWLNLIDRKNDGKALQKTIYIWILKHSK